MKIVCESCGAKYSIADEKVAGRVFKIRCKKCGAAIVVRGDQQGAAEEAPAPGAGGYDYGGDAVWHAVVDGDQQGPFSPAQLGAMISAGQIGWDAYVWREGFEDWKPAQDVEELVQAIMNPGGGGDAGAAAAEPAADPFTETATVAAAPAAAKTSSRDAGADLFASSSASPFGGGDEDDVVASAPGPRVSVQQAMTGQRNENSVLFSLSNLQALATGGAGGASASSGSAKPTAKPGMASGEGSGLIDIRALASATGLGAAPAATAPAAAPPKVDDLLSIGAPSVGLGSALAAPVIIADKTPEKSSNTPLIAAAVLGGCVLLAAGVIAAVMLNSGPDPAVAAGPTALAPGATPPAAPATAAPAVGAVAPATPATPATPAAPAAPATAAETPTASAPATSSGETSGSGSSSSSSGSSGRSGRRGGGGGSSGSSSSSGGGASAAEPATSSTPATPSGASGGARRSSGSSSIDDLLESALRPSARGGSGGGSGSGSAPAASSGSGGAASGPETPSRSDVVTAMQGVQGAVTACGNGEHGTATVSITVSGSTGRVTAANVSGQFAGTPVGSCIARAVRGATFPRFTRPTFTVNYPFRI